MKVLTLNCHSWQEENQREKIRILAETIAERSYDVIALQEVSQLMEAKKVDDQLKEDNYLLLLIKELHLLGVTDYHYVWDFAHIGFDVYEEGVALLTKHPIRKTHSFVVSQSKDPANFKTRRIVGLEILYQNKPMSFYSCHLGWWQDEEEPFTGQADALCSYVQDHEPVFLMGDFNNAAQIQEEGYHYLLNKGYRDTYELALEKDSGITVDGKITGWDDNKRDLRIDYIFTNKRLQVKNSAVVFNGENKPVISDHFGVEVEILV
ncbi:endonuclease/exonuclease/phosphatase family protein [Alkalihalobacillus sp. MEB130]|uniref:endonuclease/exonuclease/phosphatase family protein n=1 Tax=Alkalihalobacillus sp. MEB130 TaxID=2976704 RepID=UPI0028E0909E|nr:endonuclease/exonuclease/phosphatase family protein [Alkalihalobacillus sp. MEB130]MDT8862615.1 endonuclease/exonuclease/phosphatase family protein [Alkalihalobacillus sp. MEB130]